MKYSAYGVFRLQKAEMNFAPSNFQKMDEQQSAYGVHTKQLFLLSKSQNEFGPT